MLRTFGLAAFGLIQKENSCFSALLVWHKCMLEHFNNDAFLMILDLPQTEHFITKDMSFCDLSAGKLSALHPLNIQLVSL